MSLEVMSLEDQIHQRVLHMAGVATVYAADPVWLTAVKSLGALLGSSETTALPYVVLSEDEREGQPLLTVKVRIGTDGSLPAPDTARQVAADIRAHLAVHRPDAEVKIMVEIAAVGV